MLRIFISYRRADSRWPAARIYDRMAEAFGKENIFKDVDNISMGSDFRGVITEAVNNSGVILVIIGPHWLTVADEHGNRRLDNPDDFVRLEVQTALWRQSALTIPVLVDNAHMPRSTDLPDAINQLAFRNATSVREDPDFHNDVTRLIDALNKHFGIETTPSIPLSPVNFNLGAVIARYYQCMDDKAWETAREILAQIRASGKSSRVFDLDQAEHDIWEAEQQEKAEEEYNVLRLMAARAKPLRVWERLQIFWEIHPGYDPDNLADKIRPQEPSVGMRLSAPDTQQNINRISGGTVIGPQINYNAPASPAPTLLQTALERARTFNSKRNRDWQPFVTTFPDLKISNMPFCLVPVGTFQMGSEDGSDNEKPVHPQTIERPYWIAQYPVTNAQWSQAVKAGAVSEPLESGDSLKWYKELKMANAPVVGVTWFMARDFAAWLGCRLPTELEWEFAARGVESLRYPWGDNWDENIPVWSKNSGGKPAVVTSKPEGTSWVEARHMSGNVWEWINSPYVDYPYQVEDGRERDSGNNIDVRRVLRGGSCRINNSVNLRSACRSLFNPAHWFSLGFRLVRS